MAEFIISTLALFSKPLSDNWSIHWSFRTWVGTITSDDDSSFRLTKASIRFIAHLVFDPVTLRVFYLLILILLICISPAYIFSHLFQLGSQSLLETFYSDKSVSVSTLYGAEESLPSSVTTVLSSQTSPFLIDNNSFHSWIERLPFLKKLNKLYFLSK